MRKTVLLLASTALALLLSCGVAFAYPADLDSGFGSGGKVFTDFYDAFDGTYSVETSRDGKTTAAGVVFDGRGGRETGLAKYNPDGSLDPSFGGDGKVTTSLANEPMGLGIQKDGKIVTAGIVYNYATDNDFALVRHNPDGSVDTSFGTDGVAYTDFSEAGSKSNDVPWDMVIQPDGKILVSGAGTLVRYNQNGSLDPTFGVDGKVSTSGLTVELQQDGKVVVAGNTTEGFALQRFDGNGSLDTSFGTGGRVVTAIGGNENGLHDLVVQPDGKLIVAGSSNAAANGEYDMTLLRYHHDGSLDPTFAGDGIVTTDFGTPNDGSGEQVLSLALQPGGKIVAAGNYWSAGTSTRLALARYMPNGDLDTTFGIGGQATTEGLDHPWDLAMMPDGNSVVSAGYGNSDFALARYELVDVNGPRPVIGLEGSTSESNVALSWTNPSDSDFEATRILRSTTNYATTATQTQGQTNVYEGTGTTYTDRGLTNGTTYYYTAFARDEAGNWSSRSTTTAKPVPAKPTTLTLSSSESLVQFNGETVLTGKLSTSAGPIPEEKPVVVQRSTDNGSTWQNDGTATYDSMSKSYKASRSLTANAIFRLRFGGDPFHTAATSPGVLVKAKAYLTQPVTPDTVARNASFTTYGFVEPLHSGSTPLYFYRYEGGRYKLYERLGAKNAPYDETSTKYTLRYKLPYAGKWMVKARHSDASHAPTWSPAREFVVSR